MTCSVYLPPAVDTFGHVDIMVNNAGVETRTSILDTTEPNTIRCWTST